MKEVKGTSSGPIPVKEALSHLAVVATVFEAPVAAFTSPSNSPVASRVSFDASGSTAVGSAIVGYEWDFGDGAMSTEQNPIHTYNNEGAFIVSLTAASASGNYGVVKAANCTHWPGRK